MRPAAIQSHPRSLIRSVFLRAMIIVILGMTLIGAVAATTVSSLVNRGFDAQLRMGSLMLVSLMSDELAARRAMSPPQPASCDQPLLSGEDRQAFTDFARWRMFRVWYGGRACWASRVGPDLTAPGASSFSRFQNIRDHGVTWRYYTYAAPHNGPVVQVGEPLGVRRRIVARMVLEMIIPFLLIAILLIFVLLRGMRASLKNLYLFSETLAMQKDRPPFLHPQPEDWARELHPLIRTLNRLFTRIEEAIGRERRFIDMAAHQLRTPLAGLSIEAQLAARSQTPEELEARLAGVHASTQRVSGLVDQLLILAQVEATVRPSVAAVAVKDVLSSVIADIALVAARRQVEIAVEMDDDAELTGPEALLHPLLANLIDNAVKYSPEGGEVLVEVHKQALIISDSGPGMSREERAHGFERFWRAPGNNRPGAGLGLAIAQEAATRLSARLSLEDRGDGRSGLQVRVSFGDWPEG
ncbi:ATP-binding protein [Asticcacaulis sp. EMRT-3]|uniref:ATP-binding protein n=1 Tax=Asticcacaulis sp. EMRT-3 TaxID=3040349 RepID=UPI0024AF807E|nr:ATP-binding protein [Asticcacaulis sp. EMRT-3]MDI7774390.1 ATP-binding protein [Asticcacaulis sp. EMRT-3]